ncbi:hypothetical protein Tco_0613317 [Tanacetum coccineum]
MIAPSSSRYSSNDMVHNHYLEEAKKKTQESGRNSRPSVMPFARSQSTANGSKPKPRINNQKSRNCPASKWVPTGMIFTSSTTMVDSEPPHGSNTDITNLQECIQTLDLSTAWCIIPPRFPLSVLFAQSARYHSPGKVVVPKPLNLPSQKYVCSFFYLFSNLHTFFHVILRLIIEFQNLYRSSFFDIGFAPGIIVP